jgi:hypothetical protein
MPEEDQASRPWSGPEIQAPGLIREKLTAKLRMRHGGLLWALVGRNPGERRFGIQHETSPETLHQGSNVLAFKSSGVLRHCCDGSYASV